MVLLYEHPFSPYAQKCKIALREKGVDFEAVLPEDMGTGRAGGEFVRANPRAEVPALVDGEVRVFDSTIILEYIEDRWPDPPLLPASPAERARVRMIEDVVDTHYDAINWAILEIVGFKRATGKLGKDLLAETKRQTERMQAWLTKQLGDAPWFNGSGFGWGDVVVLPFVGGSAAFGNAPSEGTRLAEWFTRAGQRESVTQTNAEAMVFAADMPDLKAAVDAGLLRREYRDHRLEWMVRSGGLSVVLEGLEKNTIRFSEQLD